MLSNIIIYGEKAFPFANNATIMQSTHMIYDLYLWLSIAMENDVEPALQIQTKPS